MGSAIETPANHSSPLSSVGACTEMLSRRGSNIFLFPRLFCIIDFPPSHPTHISFLYPPPSQLISELLLFCNMYRYVWNFSRLSSVCARQLPGFPVSLRVQLSHLFSWNCEALVFQRNRISSRSLGNGALAPSSSRCFCSRVYRIFINKPLRFIGFA